MTQQTTALHEYMTSVHNKQTSR